MSAQALEAALAAMGLHARVEAEGPLAILTIADGSRLADGITRDAVVALARQHGFSHVALELTDDPGDGASLPGD
ncbi:MAG TPA: hypothetical protein VJ672_14995 [Gemmatimonadaceae bacterium]|nr:hypothetical protein [Gemmatimonadaceae bacterium]